MPTGSLGGSNATPLVRKVLVSVKLLSAILGPEMAARILWTPGGFWGGGSADFIFMGARIFLNLEGGAEAPFTARTSPVFGENAFYVFAVSHENRATLLGVSQKRPSVSIFSGYF